VLEKKTSYDHGITELWHIEVRQIIRIMEDGKELSKSYHRHVISPGDDYSGEDERTKKIAKIIHTSKCIKAYRAEVAENELKLI